ncbi:hypothetical protein V6N12_053046 [Hibiscus sabdariffa]|uniref:Uncharacterized protein n=1 Tax=Hibiscus sabdariffa TaxID=183260 RepID=A0ABR2AX63_9ROSI
MSYPYKNRTLLIQSNSCYVKDDESYDFMKAYAQAMHIKAGQSIAVKALESGDGFHLEPSIRNFCVGDDEFLAETEDYDIDAAAAICLQNCHINNEVYVVEFFWEREEPEDLAFDIIDELKSRKKKFVTVRVPVGFQEKAISNILPPEEARDADAVEINGVNDQFTQDKSCLTCFIKSHERPALQSFKTAALGASSSAKAPVTFTQDKSCLMCFIKSHERPALQSFKTAALGASSSAKAPITGNTTYCCLIAHFIDDDWELKTKILTVKPLEHIHDTKALGEIIRSSVAEWNIGKKVCSITVDNSALDDDMVQQIKETCLSDQDSLSSAHWFISCTLLEDGLREIDDILFKLRKSIEYASETTRGKLKFQEAVDKMKLQDGKSWNYVSFRLDSDFDILDSALGSRELFCQLEKIDVNFKLNPSMEEWEKALALHNCLKCFDDVKGTKSLTEDFYFPKLCNIYKSFLQLEKRNHPIITLLKSKFDHYWSLCNLALAIATVLDPRYAKNMTESVSDLDGSNSSTTETENVCVLDYFRKSVSANEVASWKSELDRYLEEPSLPLDDAFFDILGWWHVKSQTFPTLGRIARDLLAMPVSFFAPCSDFIAMITNPAYSSLNPKSMEAFVCCQNWLEIPKESKANFDFVYIISFYFPTLNLEDLIFP